jgi:Holliday junction resolvasome RuvABC ATP-dependent DNA helicase subunit
MAQFIGQTKIMTELNYIIPQARAGHNFNILLSARSGYGKTFLGLKVVAQVATYKILIEEDARKILGAINGWQTRANLIDEVHLVKNMEILYPMMDSDQYFLMFATNQSYELPEAFKRRCIQLVFEQYTKDELARIAADCLQGLSVDRASLDEIVRASNYTPGNIKLLCIRLRYVFAQRGGFSLHELTDTLNNIFNIKDGLDVRCREYLECLGRVPVLSLDSLSYIMGVSKDTVKNEIESVLINKGLIKITSKGRSLA